MRISILKTAVLYALSSSIVFADPFMVKGKVDAVTVYRGQAMVSRQVELPKQSGFVELVVTDLPTRIVPGSLFAEGPEGIQVRSVLFRQRAVAMDVRDEVRKLDDQIKAQQAEAEKIRRSGEVIAKNTELLNKMEQFVAPTSQVELTRGVLNAETLEKLTTMIFSKREALSTAKLESDVKMAAINTQIELLQRQRGEITSGASNTTREAVILLDARDAGKTIKLNYLVDSASWSPSYTINATSGKPAVSVLYQAAISQMSGEEWIDVAMTLSTATPSVVSRAPVLNPLVLALRKDIPQEARQDENGYVEQLKMRRSQALNNFNSNSGAQGGGFGGGGSLNINGVVSNTAVNIDNLKAANAVAGELQMAELSLRDKSAAKSLNKSSESVTVTYLLPNRTTLQSRTDEQLVGINTFSMKSDFYKLAVPVMTPYVYDEASVTNESKNVLLAGPSVSYMNGEFVGHGDIPTTFAGGSFTAGFGIDASLRASRELVERNEQTQGGNNIITFDYRLSVENFSDKPAKIRVLERIPKNDGNQVKPTLVSNSVEVSKDAEYERTLRKQGILRFDLEVPAQSINSGAKTIDYKLTIEHDRQMSITTGG